jgi:thiosulfate/3-mercaptopyruvate sulfurtransferase
MTSSSSTAPLVGPAELAAELRSGHRPVLLDVRWGYGGALRDDYLAGHLPGAVFADLDVDLAAPPGPLGRHPLPEPAALQAFLRAAGISADTPVVAYDGTNSSIAARAWWLLRWAGHRDVRVLDGGYPAWLRADQPVETGEASAPAPGAIVLRPGAMPTVDIDAVAAAVAGHAPGVLLDARAAERYRGEVEPLDPVAGHIPGAVSLPLTDLVTADGTFRTPAEIAERFAAAGVSPGESMAVASCGSGVTACHLILAGELAGLSLALYPGSYSGWCATGRPVAVAP